MNVNRAVLIDWLHLVVLANLAVAQPLYDLLGRHPEFLVAHKADPAHIIGMVGLLTGGVGLGLVLVELGAWLTGERVRHCVHAVLVFVLAALIALPMVKQWVSGADLIIWGLVFLMGLVFVVLYVRWQAVRLFVTVLSPVVVVFPVWFLVLTPVGRIVWPDVIGAHVGIEINNPVPVIVVVLDEFNSTALLDAEGNIDPVRFPNFAALAGESWWFPNATAAHIETTVAVSGILTGRNRKPGLPFIPTATDHPQNLFTLLGAHYGLNVIEPLTTLCPYQLCTEDENADGAFRSASFWADVAVIYSHIIMPPQIRKELPSLEAQWTGFGAGWMGEKHVTADEDGRPLGPSARATDNRESSLAHFLSHIEKTSQPALHFLHVVLPHTRYEYLVSGQQYLTERQDIPVGWTEGPGWGGRWIGGESLIITAYHRYLQQIGYLDRFLGQLRHTLETTRLYEKALIILTADHGVAFQRGLSMREVENGNERDILKVPMFVKLPGQREGRISEKVVSGIDILPTIADVLDVRGIWSMDGRSMFSNEQTPRTEIAIPGAGHFTAKDVKGFPRLEWQVEHFGIHTSLHRLVPHGPHSDLVGQAVTDLAIGQPSGLRFYGGDLEYLEQVNPASNFLPALFSAYVLETGDRDLSIAIALNGKIWATTTTSEWDRKRNYFSVLLPPAAFKNGRNAIRVYQIGKAGGTLMPIDWGDRDKTVRLGYDRAGQIQLVFSEGRENPINLERGVMRGNLDSVRWDGNMLVFAGWGADLEENQPVTEVFIFVGNVLFSRGELGFSRPDVADAYQQPSLLGSGFYAVMPVDVLKSHGSEIRVILVSQGDRNLGLSLSEKQKNVIGSAHEKSGGRH